MTAVLCVNDGAENKTLQRLVAIDHKGRGASVQKCLRDGESHGDG
jgi:hypothetical protein